MRDAWKFILIMFLAVCVNFDTEARPIEELSTPEDAIWQCYDYGIYTFEIAELVNYKGLITQSHVRYWNELEDFCLMAYELTTTGKVNHYDD